MRTLRVWQIPDDNGMRARVFLFESFDTWLKYGMLPRKEYYVCVYAEHFDRYIDEAFLEECFIRFNLNIPSSYDGRSMSTSDVIEIIDDSGETVGAYYVNDSGFKNITDSFSSHGDYEETDIIEENDALADKNDFIDWLFNERRGDALKLYAQYARKITKEDKA